MIMEPRNEDTKYGLNSVVVNIATTTAGPRVLGTLLAVTLWDKNRIWLHYGFDFSLAPILVPIPGQHSKEL